MYSTYSDPNVCFSQVFIYKSLIQCLRILEVNLKLEVRMSFKIQLTELSSLHINLYTILLSIFLFDLFLRTWFKFILCSLKNVTRGRRG